MQGDPESINLNQTYTMTNQATKPNRLSAPITPLLADKFAQWAFEVDGDAFLLNEDLVRECVELSDTTGLSYEATGVSLSSTE